MMDVEMWVIIGLIAVVFKSAYQSGLNRFVAVDQPLAVTHSLSLVSSFLFGVIVIVVQPSAPPLWGVGLAALAGVFLGLGLWSFTEALSVADFSIVSPFQQLIPIVTAIVEPVVIAQLGYRPAVVGGAVLVGIGAYVVLLEPSAPFAPLRNIQSRGPLLGIATAILFGLAAIITSATTKQMSFPLYVFIQLVAAFTAISLIRRDLPRVNRNYALVGLLYTLNIGFSNFTLSLTAASNAVIVFRLSLLVNVLVGVLLFDEQGLLYRLIGALIIVAGIALTLFG